MNYERENEFGQRPGAGRRNPPMREGMGYAQGGEGYRRPPSFEGGWPAGEGGAGNPRMYGRDMEGQGGTARGLAGTPGFGGAARADLPPDATGRIRIPDDRVARRGTAAGQEPGVSGESAASGGADARPRRRVDRSARAGSVPPPDDSIRERAAQAKMQKEKRRRFRGRVLGMIVAECFALLFIFTYGYFARRLTLIQREEFDPKEVGNKEISLDTIKKMKGYRMFAIFGVDSRNSNVGAGSQSDVIIICCINEDTGEIKLASVYRDTYLNINDEGSYRKVNAAYTNGGPQQALKTLNKNLDLNITDYITFSWKSVAEGINILGGVDLEVTKSEFKFINGFITETVKATDIGSYQLKSPGMQHLDGVQAVAYGRLRLMDTDYARTERQRKIIELAFAKAKQADYSVLNNILVVVLPNVSTNITFADMTSMALGISKYHIGETTGFPFAKGNANMPGKGDCVIPQTLESNVKQLHTFLFGDEDYETTDQVKQISNKIAGDTGMYKEGVPFKGSALSTDGYAPETTKDPERERETTASEEETDGDGTATSAYEGETDENGQLIDAPIEDWPEEALPSPGGIGSGYGPGVGVNGYNGTNGNNGMNGNNYGPGGNANLPGPGTAMPGTTAPAMPGESENSGESQGPAARGPVGTVNAPATSEEVGPGVSGNGGNGPGSQSATEAGPSGPGGGQASQTPQEPQAPQEPGG